MSIEDFVLIKKYNEVKLQKYLLNRYEALVRHLSKLIISKYYLIPITWEDVYVESLFALPKIFSNFDPEKNDNINLFLSTNLIYFMKNYCRRWLTKNSSVLNNALEFDEQWQISENTNYETIFPDSSSGWMDKYTEEEKRVITFLLDSGKSLGEICKLTGLSRYKLNTIVNSIKLKLENNR